MPMVSPRSNGSPKNASLYSSGASYPRSTLMRPPLCGGLNFLPPERAGRSGAPSLKCPRADALPSQPHLGASPWAVIAVPGCTAVL